MKTKIIMWQVDVIKKETNEKIKVIVPAKTNEQATRLVSGLYPWGYDEPYKWFGTGPAYGSNNIRLAIEV